MKSISTKEILGIDINTYRRWIEYQFTPEMNWSNIEIDHVKPIFMFDISDDGKFKDAFNWKNTEPLLKHDHQQKGIKYNFLDYQIQFVKAYQFIKLNDQEGLSQDFINEIFSKPPNKNYETSKIIYNHIDEIWSIDLTDFSDCKISNDEGFSCLFVIIDNFSNNTWCIPSKKI